ncbi:hypothetical protein BVG80_02480 [Sphingobacteriales bacterium TSM_CSM]|nr:hypothetical protein BVG80_02480 [Sphingobacteriales bacterium TSM_CSM]
MHRGNAFNLPDEAKFLLKKAENVKVRDSQDKEHILFDLLKGDKPVIISPIYTKCPKACSLISSGLKNSIDKLKTLGKDFTIITFSFDSTDTAEDMKRFEDRWNMDGQNWRVVTGKTGADITSLLTSLDYQYEYNENIKEYLHPNIVVVLTPTGRISRYIYGIEPKPNDLKLAVIEAKKEKSGVGIVEGFYLRCFVFDPATKTYQLDWGFIIQTSAGLFFIFVIGILLARSFIFD